MSRERCSYCGGPLLGPGAVTDEGDPAHAICNSKGRADPDMNPEEVTRSNSYTVVRAPPLGTVRVHPKTPTRPDNAQE